MKTHFIEASHGGGGNWGKFLLGQFEAEDWEYKSALPEAPDHSLLFGRGWGARTILFLDLQTGEGSLLTPGGIASADLNKHAIWVCPMAEPFLEWLYQQPRPLDITTLPTYIELPEAPFAMSGYRREGLSRRVAELEQALATIINTAKETDWEGPELAEAIAAALVVKWNARA